MIYRNGFVINRYSLVYHLVLLIITIEAEAVSDDSNTDEKLLTVTDFIFIFLSK